MNRRRWDLLNGLLVPRREFVAHTASGRVLASPVPNRVAALHLDVSSTVSGTTYTPDIHEHSFTLSGGSISATTKKYGIGAFIGPGLVSGSSSDFVINQNLIRFWFYVPAGLPFSSTASVVIFGSFGIYVQQGSSGLIPKITGSFGSAAASLVLSAGVWHYAALTITIGSPSTNRNLTLYIDGSQAVPQSGNFTASLSNLSGGSIAIGSSSYAIGCDEFEFYTASSGSVSPPTGSFPDSA